MELRIRLIMLITEAKEEELLKRRLTLIFETTKVWMTQNLGIKE